MGQVFGSSKPLKEIVRDNQRLVKKAVRELDREISNMQSSVKKLEKDMRTMAKQGQMSTVRIMAKDLHRTKTHINKFIELKTHLNAVGLKLQTVKSHDAMATAMKGVTKALKSMNKQMSLPGLQKVMAEFMKENERSELVMETMGDTMDEAFEVEGEAEDEEMIVNQILDEMGINMGAAVPEAPTTATMTSAQAAPAAATETREPVAAGADPALMELEARLNNLKR